MDESMRSANADADEGSEVAQNSELRHNSESYALANAFMITADAEQI